MYKRQDQFVAGAQQHIAATDQLVGTTGVQDGTAVHLAGNCLLYTSDAADERSSVDLGGRRIIKKTSDTSHRSQHSHETSNQSGGANRHTTRRLQHTKR